MLTRINRSLIKHAPWLQKGIRATLRACAVPIPRRVGRRRFLTYPALALGPDAEPHILAWIEDMARPGDTFLDVGANVGWISLVASRCVGAGGRVVAFEPSPPLIGLLRYHKRVNLASNLTVESSAVSDRPGRAMLYLQNAGMSALNSLTRTAVMVRDGTDSQGATVEVAKLTLDEYCRQKNLGPRIIKIDVEGAELMVLRGAREILQRYSPTLILAVHPAQIPEGGTDELFALLADHGYEIRRSNTIMSDGKVWTADHLLQKKTGA